jgi:hypothetical protein
MVRESVLIRARKSGISRILFLRDALESQLTKLSYYKCLQECIPVKSLFILLSQIQGKFEPVNTFSKYSLATEHE